MLRGGLACVWHAAPSHLSSVILPFVVRKTTD